MRASNLKGAEIYESNLMGTNLKNAKLIGATFYQSNLNGADLTGTSLDEEAAAFIHGESTTRICNTVMPDGDVTNRDCEK